MDGTRFPPPTTEERLSKWMEHASPHQQMHRDRWMQDQEEEIQPKGAFWKELDFWGWWTEIRKQCMCCNHVGTTSTIHTTAGGCGPLDNESFLSLCHKYDWVTVVILPGDWSVTAIGHRCAHNCAEEKSQFKIFTKCTQYFKNWKHAEFALYLTNWIMYTMELFSVLALAFLSLPRVESEYYILYYI